MADPNRAFLPFLARDVALLAVTGAAVAYDRAAGPDGWLWGVLCGGLVALTGFLVHEWGHWLGTRWSGGLMKAPARIWAPFLFAFDTARSTPRQFLAMSVGGYVATVIAVIGVALAVDVGRPSGMVALGLTVLGMIVTFALEVPTTVRVARGGDLPTGGVYSGEAP